MFIKKHSRAIFRGELAFIFWLVCAVASWGQVVRPQFETAERQQMNSPTIADDPSQGNGASGELPVSTDGNGDLGEQWILQAKTRPKAWTASAEVAAYHTSNVALSARDEADDNYLIGQLTVGWQRALTGKISFDISLQQAFFRYDEFTSLNFDSLNLGCGLSGPVSFLSGSTWYARYNFNRLSAENFGGELYTSHSFLAGAQKVFQLSRADSLFVGVSGQLNIADPASLERREYGVYGGYAVALTRSVSVNAIYRAALYDYSEGDRADFNQTLSVAMQWNPLPPLAVSGSISGGLNRSDESSFDYDLLTAGASLSVTYQF